MPRTCVIVLPPGPMLLPLLQPAKPSTPSTSTLAATNGVLRPIFMSDVSFVEVVCGPGAFPAGPRGLAAHVVEHGRAYIARTNIRTVRAYVSPSGCGF